MAGGGGAWKVAYADFVTAMMAFFMVMWLVGQKEGTKEAVASYFSDPFATGGQEGNHGEARHEIPHRAHGPDKKNSKKPAKEERPKQVTLRLQGVGNHTSVAMAILFAPGSAELDHSGEANLEQILPALLGRPQKIELRGHASRRPLPAGSGFADAWALSYARCQAVRQYLETHGIELDRIRLSQAGTTEAVGNIDDDDYLAKQERVEVRMLTETAQDWQPAEAKPKAAKPKHDDTHAAAAAPAAAHGH